MATTTQYYDIFNLVTTGLLIPMIVSAIAFGWAIGIGIKAMQSSDLT